MSLTPKEKAEELVDLYKPLVTIWDCYWDCPRHPDDILTDAKQCALIAAKLILQQFIEVYKDLISLGVVKQPIEELKEMATKRFISEQGNDFRKQIKEAQRGLDDLETLAFEKFN